jgi:hypothetical protein
MVCACLGMRRFRVAYDTAETPASCSTWALSCFEVGSMIRAGTNCSEQPIAFGGPINTPPPDSRP